MAHNRVHAVVVADDEAPEPPVIADVDLVAAAASGRFDTMVARDIAGTEALHSGRRFARARRPAARRP